MSVPATPVVRFRDPRVAIERSPIIAIDQGAEYIDNRRTASTTFNKDQITFNELSTGGSGMILDRKMFVEYSYHPVFEVQNYSGQNADVVLWGNATPTEIKATAVHGNDNSVYFSSEPFNANDDDGAELTAEQRCTQSLNNILSIIGLSGPHRKVGPRALGLLQSTKNLQVTINGHPISQQLEHYINALEWYDNHGSSDHADYSKCASYPDLFKTYREGASARTNPLATYGSQQGRETRGALWYIPNESIKTEVVLNDLRLAANVNGGSYYRIDGFAFEVLRYTAAENHRITIGKVYLTTNLGRGRVNGIVDPRLIRMVEPIVLPLFNIGEPQSRGLYGVDKFSVDFSLTARLAQKWWCGDVFNVPGLVGDLKHNIITTIELGADQNGAYMHYNLLKPHIMPTLPPVNTYQCKQVLVRSVFIKKLSELGENATFSVSSGNIDYGSIPSRIYFYIKEQTDGTEVQDTDTFCRIDRLNFQFTGMGSQYGACQTEQLYHMCKESGLKMSLPQWRDHVGSVACIDFAKNVNLGINDYAGMLGQFRCDFNVDCTLLRKSDREHVNGNPVNNSSMVLYIVVVEEGVATISNNMCVTNKGTAQVALNTIPAKFRDYDQKWNNIYGGSFVDSIKKIGHTAAKIASRGISLGKAAAPYVEKALPYIEKGLALALPALAAGAGISEGKARKILKQHGEEEGVRMLKHLAKGGTLIGGGVVGGKTKKIKGGKQTFKNEMSKYLAKA